MTGESPHRKWSTADTGCARPHRTGVSARRRQAGIGVLDIMIALALAALILSTSLQLARAARSDASTDRMAQELASLSLDIRQAWAGPHGTSYAGITAADVYARTYTLASAYVPDGSGGRFQIRERSVRIAPSAMALDASGAPMSTGVAGDSFQFQISGLPPEACSRTVVALAGDLTAAAVVADGNPHPVGVRAHLSPATLATTCGLASTVDLVLHFN